MNDLANICHEAAIKIVGHFETVPYKRRPKHTAELKRAEEAVRAAIVAATYDLRHGCLAALGYIRGASLMNQAQITAELLEIVTPYVVSLPDGRPGTKPIEESPGDLAVREDTGDCCECGERFPRSVLVGNVYCPDCAEDRQP